MDIAGAAYDFKVALEGIPTTQEMGCAFATYLADLGVTAHAMGELANPHQPKSVIAPIFSTCWPPEWAERWTAKNYICADPVVFGALGGVHAFYWHEVRPMQRGLGARIMDEGAEFGLRDGFCIPIHRPGTLPAAVSLAGERLEFSPMEKQLLELCAIQVFDKLEKLMRPVPPAPARRLSDREREVLHWIAAGKSTPAIADILTLSEHTVRGYVKSAMRKLNVTTHAQAVAIGIRLGELLP